MVFCEFFFQFHFSCNFAIFVYDIIFIPLLHSKMYIFIFPHYFFYNFFLVDLNALKLVEGMHKTYLEIGLKRTLFKICCTAIAIFIRIVESKT